MLVVVIEDVCFVGLAKLSTSVGKHHGHTKGQLLLYYFTEDVSLCEVASGCQATFSE